MTHPMPTTAFKEVLAALLKYVSNLIWGFHLEGLPWVLGHPWYHLLAGTQVAPPNWVI